MRYRALAWKKFDAVHYRFSIWNARHGTVAAFIALLLLVVISSFWVKPFQQWLAPIFTANDRLQTLRLFFLTLGGALVGAVAIVSSLVLFAMQVNVERMPYGLFQRLSSDRQLLSAFGGTFLLAIAIIALSQIPSSNWVSVSIMSAFWGTILILTLFLFSYRRALLLVSPTQQLKFVVDRTRRDMRAWMRRAKRAESFLQDRPTPRDVRKDPFASKLDMPRHVFFQVNRGWTNGAKQSVRYAASYARRYAEHGDHEISGVALDAIVAINAAYIEAKGTTFFANQLLIDNPFTSDAFINDTLEQLRQTTRIGVSRKDEQQIEQTLRALASLVQVYSMITYPNEHDTKTHAHLAAAYLSGEVERIVPHVLPDVLMEGVRLMGQCGDLLLAAEGPSAITTLVQKIGVLACCGIAREDYRPVTLTAVEQLARLSLGLLRTRAREVKFAAREIRSSMGLLTRLFLALPDTPLSSIHSTYLAPFYSMTSAQALPDRLREFTNTVIDANTDNADLRKVVGNIEEWADGLHEMAKEVLLEVVGRRSHLTFDIIRWISHVTMLLLAFSTVPASTPGNRTKLQHHALWLISVLSFVPDDKQAVTFVETFHLTTVLFDAAVESHGRGCDEISDKIGELLLSWAFKGGQYLTGMEILEQAVYGVATLALAYGGDAATTALKEEVRRRLEAGGLPDEEARDHAARNIRERAETLYRAGHWSSTIEQGMAQVDDQKLEPLLREIANLISPRTAEEPVRVSLF